MSECYLLKKKEQQQDDAKPTGYTSLTTTPQSCVDDNTVVHVKESSPDITMHGYEPFISEATVSLCATNSQPAPIAILQD